MTSRGQLAGKHHEIYLTDIRRADPAELEDGYKARWRNIALHLTVLCGKEKSVDDGLPQYPGFKSSV